jgi:hypothetical protein
LAPLTGVLDLRSEPDNMVAGSLRYRGNLQTVNDKTLRRGMGWSKLFSKSAYNNSDLHDQLLLFNGSTREPITMLREMESSRSVRQMFAATRSRVFVLNEYSGNWQVIGWGMGGGVGTDCSGPRFQCDVLGDYVVLTNGFDLPMYHILEQAPNADGSMMSPFADLALIGLTSARKLWVWNNVVFLADVVMDGAILSYRIVWSDYNDPTSFDPSKIGSMTGFQDLNFGERVLGGAPSSNGFIIYTNQKAWLMSVNQSTSADSPPFVFQVLPGTTPQNCLFYENTLVNLGDGHIYAGRDRLYYFNQWIGLPEPLEWLHSADAVVYEKIRSDVCEAHVGVFDNNEVLVSFLTTESTNGCPDITLRINRTYKTVDIVDSGFTAFCQHRPQATPTIRDLLVEENVCSLYSLLYEGYGWLYEGLPYPLPTPSDTAPNSIYNPNSLVGGRLRGVWWQLPVTSFYNIWTGLCTDPAPKSTVVNGDPTKLYDISVLIRGVMEFMKYTGGTVVAGTNGNMVSGGTPVNDGHNLYTLQVSNPPQTFYINAWNGLDDYNLVAAIRYSATIQAYGGATFTFSAASVNGTEVTNNLGVVLDALPDEPDLLVGEQPYDNQGQWCQMDAPGASAPGEIDVEDYTADPDPGSLCSILEGRPDLFDCKTCNPDFVLVGAHSTDWCLKQIGSVQVDGKQVYSVFYRERCTNPSAIGVSDMYGYTSSHGTYVLDGYDSIIRFAPAYSPEMLIEAVKLTLNHLPAPGTDSTITLRVGVSGQVADSNSDNCMIKWFTLSAKQLKCLNQLLTQAAYAKKNAVPNISLEWNFLYTGKYLHFELKISGTGGDCLLGGINGQIKGIGTRNF